MLNTQYCFHASAGQVLAVVVSTSDCTTKLLDASMGYLMGHVILEGEQPDTAELARRAALERMYADAGLPAELAHDLDLLWRQPPEPAPAPIKANHGDLTADEIAALKPMFAPLWRRWSSIGWAGLLEALLTTRPGPARTRRDPETKRESEKLRSLLRRLAKTDFWEAAAAGIEALETLDAERKERLLAVCRTQAGRAHRSREAGS